MGTLMKVTATRPPTGSSGRTTWSRFEVNRLTTPANMRWKLIDRQTGAENAAIDSRFRVGERVKIRLLNEMAGDHPMHHPFHVHGAGRFLILSRGRCPRRQSRLEGHRAGAGR
jgi:FtsP/CotA-like multicopper oxidase with cupredoxin domain